MTKTRWYCEHKHSFDVAKQGYINLLPAQYKKSKQPGDDSTMIVARQQFLAKGFYLPLRKGIIDLLDSEKGNTHHLLDIGCGDGYYTHAFADIAQHVTALDISKSAVLNTAKRKLDNVSCLVASASKLPLIENTVDVITSVFSPIIPNEMSRVMRKNGLLIIAKPQPKHVIELRKQLFDEVKLHDSDKFITQLAPDFQLINQKQITFSVELDNDMLKNLLVMTPYAYRATPEKRQTLEKIEHIKVTADFCVYAFQKIAS